MQEEAAVTRRSKDIDDDGIDGLRNSLDWPTANTQLFDALQTYINVSKQLLRAIPDGLTKITADIRKKLKLALNYFSPRLSFVISTIE
jgi:hypothetical protein